MPVSSLSPSERSASLFSGALEGGIGASSLLLTADFFDLATRPSKLSYPLITHPLVSAIVFALQVSVEISICSKQRSL